MQQEPLISIIVRTCNRPDILINALNSICRQTYKNIETVVIEDGKNVSEKMIKENFPSMNLIYYSTGKRLGRSRVGNIGLSMANGLYFNFLDDDDELFPEHISSLFRCLLDNNVKAAYSSAEERQIIITGRNPYSYRIKRKVVRYHQQFSRLMLYHQNYIPIQSILFSREFFENKGGLDENLAVFEDWDLWVRYSTYADFKYCNKVTSAYYVSYRRKEKEERANLFYSAKSNLLKKFESYRLNVSVAELQQELDKTFEDYLDGRVIRYLKMLWAFLVYGDK